MKTLSLLYHTRGLVWAMVGGSIGYLLLRFRYHVAAVIVAASLAAIPLYAEAGSNIRQKDTGATVWENQDGDQVPVGDSGLTVIIGDVSEAATAFVVTHKAGNIVRIYSVIVEPVTSADAVLDFGRVESNAGVFQSISSSTTGNNPEGGVITITGHTTSTGSSAGDQANVIFTVGTDPALAVSQGQVIWIHSDGGSTNAVSAYITIIIE